MPHCLTRQRRKRRWFYNKAASLHGGGATAPNPPKTSLYTKSFLNQKQPFLLKAMSACTKQKKRRPRVSRKTESHEHTQDKTTAQTHFFTTLTPSGNLLMVAHLVLQQSFWVLLRLLRSRRLAVRVESRHARMLLESSRRPWRIPACHRLASGHLCCCSTKIATLVLDRPRSQRT
jgi:hypothetical protein